MIKGLFITSNIEYNLSGIGKKIRSQISCFEKEGISIKLFFVKKRKETILNKVLSKLPFTNIDPVWEGEKQISSEQYDFLYFRRPPYMNGPFIHFLEKIKSNSKTIIVMEIPTFPYDKEQLRGWKTYPLYIKELFARKKLKKVVDRIAILSKEKEIFGIPTLKIVNGFDFSTMKIRTVKKREAINICIVANFMPWHGYERAIIGLREYKDNGGEKSIMLHFVGGGDEVEYYKRIVEQNKLENDVHFYGAQKPEYLQKIFNECDIGMASMGGYKKKLFYSCELKTREYLAVGLPIIAGCEMDISEKNCLSDYILMFSNDESPIDYNKVVAFYDKLYKEKSVTEIEEMSEHIRNEAKKILSYEKMMEDVVAYIKEYGKQKETTS